MDKPKVIVLCGSTRFYNEFQAVNYELTMQGYIVLSVGFYLHSQDKAHGQEIGCTKEQKIMLDELHMRKIDLADEIFVINQHGYIGDSTKKEIEYSRSWGLPFRWYCTQRISPGHTNKRDPIGIKVDEMMRKARMKNEELD